MSECVTVNAGLLGKSTEVQTGYLLVSKATEHRSYTKQGNISKVESGIEF